MDRVLINTSNKNFVDKSRESDILGFGTAENKDIFLLAVSLGFEKPSEDIKNKETYILFNTFKSDDNALLSAVLLGTATTDKEVEEFCEYETIMDYSQRCADHGFKVLQKLVSDAHEDKDRLDARLLKKLDQLYLQNVKDDLS